MTPQVKLIKYLETQSQVIARLMPHVSCKMEGKAVHRLRVAIRRTRAALWVLRHSSADGHFKKLDRDLRSLGKALGKIPELDVAIQDARNYGINTGRLLARRKIAQRKLWKLIDRDQRKNVARQLSALKKVASAIKPAVLREACDDLRVQVYRRRERHIDGQTKLHQLRVTIKKVRFALEAMGRPVDPIKRLQDILGDTT